MMPPHVNRFVPGHGETHTGDDLVIEGYTLEYAGEDPVLVDDETGDAVAFTSTLEETRQDRGTGLPGSVQYRGVMRLTPTGLVSGRRYRLSFLGDEITFTAG